MTVGANGYAETAAIGDLNNDKNLDVVIETNLNLTGTTNYTRVIVGLGNGKGQFPHAAEVPGTDGVTGVSLADVNTDGNLDLQVRLNNAAAPTTFYGDGAGNFSTTPP